MSASERLKALTTFDYLGPDANDMDGEAWGKTLNTDSLALLARCLPQIVVVVEAAEREHPGPHNYVMFGGEEGPVSTECPTCAALAALEEALS